MSLDTFFSKESWYKEDGFWRDKNWDGSNGKYDLIYNTCGKIVYDNDMSEWAKAAILKCWILLLARKRWPDYMVHYNDTKHWFGRIINRSIIYSVRFINKIFKTHIRANLPFRAQAKMTRDPFTALYTACTTLDQYRKIELLDSPTYIFRPNFWHWRKYLVTGKPIHLKLYRFYSSRKASNLEYVNRLRALREIAITNKMHLVTK